MAITQKIIQAVPYQSGGMEGEVFVLDPVDGGSDPLPIQEHLYPQAKRHAWGEPVPGARQLAFDILCHAAGVKAAEAYLEDFLNEIVVRKSDAWAMSIEYIRGWYSGRVAREVATEDLPVEEGEA